jgi:hypothetical protein
MDKIRRNRVVESRRRVMKVRSAKISLVDLSSRFIPSVTGFIAHTVKRVSERKESDVSTSTADENRVSTHVRLFEE